MTPSAHHPAIASGRRRFDLLGLASRLAAASVVASAAALLGLLAWRLWPFGLDGAPHGPGGGWGEIGGAAAGTAWLVVLTGALALPAGIGTAIYLEEYARPKTRAASVLQAALANLCGVPSVVYGVAGLAFLVHGLSLDRTLLTGALVLAALALPPVVASSTEAIRAVPGDLRTAAVGLGATRWQVVLHQVLPVAAPGIATAACTALTRAAGAAAPLLVVGAASMVTFAPPTPAAPLVSLPTHVFGWAVRPQAEFAAHAAGATLALLAILLGVRLAAFAFQLRFAQDARASARSLPDARAPGSATPGAEEGPAPNAKPRQGTPSPFSGP